MEEACGRTYRVRREESGAGAYQATALDRYFRQPLLVALPGKHHVMRTAGCVVVDE
jgi:hypothetical protein